MEKKKKQILGFVGLIAVAIMTAVAYCLPTPDAAALSEQYECNPDVEGDCATADSGINLQVVINEATTSVAIVSPQNNSDIVGKQVKFSTNYNEVTRIDYYLTRKNDDGTTERINLPSFTPPAGTTSGTHEFEQDFSDEDYGAYQFHVIGYGKNNVIREDSVEFTYSALSISGGTTTAPNKDPIIELEINDDIEKVLIHVYDKDGTPLRTDEDGNELPFEVGRDNIDPTTGKINFTIPFEQYGAEPGEYTIIGVGYSKDDEIVSIVQMKVMYSPVVPETPNTGSALFGDLNITRADYLITGLIIFALASVLAFYLIWSKSRR